jgi:uncharacterized protein (TIGR03437 family)
MILCATHARAYERFQTPDGGSYYRTDYAGITIRVNQRVAPGMINSQGETMITADSDPSPAFQAALVTWSSVPGSAVRFLPLRTTNAVNDVNDGQNVITIGDTPEIRSVAGNALAVTVNMVMADGRIVDSDTIYNPAYRFFTTLAPGTYDLQSLETHELGHVLGANHSTVLAAAMFQFIPSSTNLEAQLSADDVAFVTAAYDDHTGSPQFGAVSGHVSSGGSPVAGASVVAINPSDGAAVAALSASDGSFTISHLPAGSYNIYAEPLAGPVLPANLYMTDASVDTAFSSTFLGANEAPRAVTVFAGNAALVSIPVRPAASLHIQAIGAGVAGGSGDFNPFGAGAFRVPSGQSLDLLLSGRGIDDGVLNGGIRLLGPGLNIHPGSARIDPAIELNGMPVVRVTVDIAAHAEPAVATIVITKNGDAATYTAGLVIAAAIPAFTSTGVVNAASFQTGAVAPGEIVSLFGSLLGPDPGIANAGFNPGSGRMSTQLAGVTATFAGVPAPLFFVSAHQINLQVPYEIAGKTSAPVVVETNGVASPPVDVLVAASAPDLFVVPGTSRVTAVNQNGTLNSVSWPAVPGSIVTLFATGQGMVSPPVPTGAAALPLPLSLANGVTVMIGGQNAKIYFAGLTPGMAGLMQVNVEIPRATRSGNAVTVQLAVSGARAHQATIAVQ